MAGWQPDLDQVRINTAQGKLNILGLFSLRPRWLVGERAAQALTPHDVFDSADFLQPIFTSPSSTVHHGLANRIIHPKGLAGGVQKALKAGKFPASLLASHAIDTDAVIQMLAANEEKFFERRAVRLRNMIAEHVQARALFGFRDGPEISSLFDEDSDESA
jgi:hypothetical protein